MYKDQIVSKLHESKVSYIQVEDLSDELGIYALFYNGPSISINQIPLKTGELIYIGKTESSQKKRNVMTHFMNGKTGSSTVRRSLELS